MWWHTHCLVDKIDINNYKTKTSRCLLQSLVSQSAIVIHYFLLLTKRHNAYSQNLSQNCLSLYYVQNNI